MQLSTDSLSHVSVGLHHSLDQKVAVAQTAPRGSDTYIINTNHDMWKKEKADKE